LSSSPLPLLVQSVGINENHSNEGGSDHHLCLAECWRKADVWESFVVRRGKTSGELWLEVVGMGQLKVVWADMGHPIYTSPFSITSMKPLRLRSYKEKKGYLAHCFGCSRAWCWNLAHAEGSGYLVK
jgi:hypothetical protein